MTKLLCLLLSVAALLAATTTACAFASPLFSSLDETNGKQKSDFCASSIFTFSRDESSGHDKPTLPNPRLSDPHAVLSKILSGTSGEGVVALIKMPNDEAITGNVSFAGFRKDSNTFRIQFDRLRETTADNKVSRNVPATFYRVRRQEQGDVMGEDDAQTATHRWRLLGTSAIDIEQGSSSSSHCRHVQEQKITFRSFMLYDVWHAYAATAVREQCANNVTSVEDVLRSDGRMQLDAIYKDGGAQARNFFYQSTPTPLGAYCLYRKRANETGPGILPECPNIPLIAKQHATMLSALGVDVIVVDGTNLGTFNNFSDALQLRPMEVLAEEWYKLRTDKHMNTPSIVAWNTVPKGSNLWQKYLDNIYNDPELSTLVARDPKSGKKIFMIPNGDPDVIKQVESNGGRNDVVVLQMWALWSAEDFVSKGVWQFMAPCRDQQQLKYTTSVANMQTCNQLVIPRSVLGSSTTVSPSYQVAYGSLPFQAAGKMDTFTLRLQFASAINNLVRNDEGVQNLVLATFNEWIAQPQANPYQSKFHNNRSQSMGLTHDKWRFKLWVDTFGGALSRGIEPSKEFGSSIFDTVASCMRVAALMKNQNQKKNKTSSSSFEQWCGEHRRRSEEDSSEQNVEPCCVQHENQTRRNVWSLKRSSSSKRQDFVLVINPAELVELLASLQWTEICNPYGGPTAFCVDESVLATDDAMSGPFLLATTAGGHSPPPPGARIGLWRCRLGPNHHFFSNDPKCEGATTEFFLGYSAANRTSEFPRALLRCYDPATGAHVHSLDLPCAIGHEERHYGYVH